MKQSMKSLALLLSLTFALTACGGGDDYAAPLDTSAALLTVEADGTTTFDSSVLSATLGTLPLESLSAAEQDSLIYMREEEKLARDVYSSFDQLWGASLPIFDNISDSEATHTEAVLKLLQRYGLPDPAAVTVAGQFINQDLQALYVQMLASGSASLIDALKVGAAIEEVDIIDIQAALVYVDNQDIRLVYENLLKGSRNHLRSFVQTLQQKGVVYVPQYLSPADYQAIISSPMERG